MLRGVDKMPGSGAGSSSSSAASEFSINHRSERADSSCEVCGGAGYTTRQVREDYSRTCAICHGSGRVEARYTLRGRMESCRHCDGTGTRWHSRLVTKRDPCDCLK